MAIINQYRAIYPVEKTYFETSETYINATSMEKAVSMLHTQYGLEPITISKIRDDVLTEITSETSVNFEIKSYYFDEDTQQEIEIPNCIAYPTSIPNAVRGNTVYLSAPNYTFNELIEDEEISVTYTFEKWIYNNEEFTDNPYVFTIPLDEEITEITIKAIYIKS